MRYDVPYFSQGNAETCWYAAAKMIFAFRAEEFPLLYTPNASLPNNSQDFAAFVREIGMLPVPSQCSSYTALTLEALLKRYGPLWVPVSHEFANASGAYYGHVVVLIGVENDKLYFNDPAARDPSGRNYKTRDIQQFNQVVWTDKPMLYLPQRCGPHDKKIVIKPRDTLSDIASREYGQWQLWPLIYDRNKSRVGANPNRIFPGMELLLAPLQQYSSSDIASARQRAHSWKSYGP